MFGVQLEYCKLQHLERLKDCQLQRLWFLKGYTLLKGNQRENPIAERKKGGKEGRSSEGGKKEEKKEGVKEGGQEGRKQGGKEGRKDCSSCSWFFIMFSSFHQSSMHAQQDVSAFQRKPEFQRIPARTRISAHSSAPRNFSEFQRRPKFQRNPAQRRISARSRNSSAFQHVAMHCANTARHASTEPSSDFVIFIGFITLIIIYHFHDIAYFFRNLHDFPFFPDVRYFPSLFIILMIFHCFIILMFFLQSLRKFHSHFAKHVRASICREQLNKKQDVMIKFAVKDECADHVVCKPLAF